MDHIRILHLCCISSQIHRYLNTEILLASCEVHQTHSSHVNITNTEKEPFLNQHLFLKGGGNAQWLDFSSKAILKNTFLVVYIFLLFIFLYDDGHPCIYQAFISEMTSKGFYWHWGCCRGSQLRGRSFLWGLCSSLCRKTRILANIWLCLMASRRRTIRLWWL